ncbi:hypothetical protein LJC30_06915 [Odoribacter sp. OttesenSCG-928-L07]|nr:hypothetical protein [Odoribacter sp. OttesenSCG-928-L07]
MEESNRIFRLRPSNDLTIDELKNNYLWFSRPTEYKDQEDANIIAFAEANENIKDTFNRIFSNYIDLGEAVSLLGICCFAEHLPKKNEWKCFPKGHNGIVIEYDRDKLEKHFFDVFYLGDCFKKVEYVSDPIVIKSSTDAGYDVLWEIDENGCCYKSLKGDIERDTRDMDEFILKLLTRINIKYQIQHEHRIILNHRNIPETVQGLKGYQKQIPIDSILNIYVHPTTPKKFINDLRSVISDNITIKTISENG